MQIFTGAIPSPEHQSLNGKNIYHESQRYDRIDFDLYIIELETTDRRL